MQNCHPVTQFALTIEIPSVPSDGGAAEHEDGRHRHEDRLARVRAARKNLPDLKQKQNKPNYNLELMNYVANDSSFSD